MPSEEEAPPERIADRYEVQAELGRGGMATAYRVLDTRTGSVVALKLLTERKRRRARSVELFEREFHTLVQLAHPRVVQAFDYGVADGDPYYTMELLDGGDVGGLSPMPWQEACAMAYEVCSVLSLLHSRGLVHRDLTPLNIRRTSDGRAKVIDFGLLAPMGPTNLAAGTPPYVAPELLQTMTLDGRSDLFSLGATLYHALTGRPPFPARRLAQLPKLWRSKPVAPSRCIDGIPPAVDELVLSLLRIDTGSRPKSAAEVMERLRPLLDAPPDGDLTVAGAYLAVPRLIGRDETVASFRRQLTDALHGHGGGFLITGEAGVGRTRALDSFVLEAKLVGAAALRAGASDAAAGSFGVAASLVTQLHTAAPDASRRAAADCEPAFHQVLAEAEELGPGEAVDLSGCGLERTALQQNLRKWLLAFALSHPLAIAVDDIHRIDEPSAALLGSLAWLTAHHRLTFAYTAEPNAGHNAEAIKALRDHANELVLGPLEPEQTRTLLASVFGEVPHLDMLSTRLHELSSGRPRDCMALAQHLADRGVVSYSGGSWTLPAELAADALPESMELALEQQCASLRPLARRIALLLSLGLLEGLSRGDLLAAPGRTRAEVDAALDELLSARIVTGGPAGYTLCHAGLARLLVDSASEQERFACHAELAARYQQTGQNPVAVAHHLLYTDNPEAGLDHILASSPDSAARVELSARAGVEIGSGPLARTLQAALREAERLERPIAEQQVLWLMLAGEAAKGEDANLFYALSDRWLEQLKRDSGWNDWQQLDPSLDAATRAMQALAKAAERYEATPEAERVLAPVDAIRQMVSYVVFAIGVSARCLDMALQAILPGLLEPFRTLNPMVDAMFGNASYTRINGRGRTEEARQGFIGLLEQLDTITGAEQLAYVDKVRAAISQTLAETDAGLGVQSHWVTRLEDQVSDPNQQVGALYVRKVAALQQGDWEGAERLRQQAELLALQSKVRPMFSTLRQELEVHATARDLTGLRQVCARIHAMAEAHPGWRIVSHLADAHYLCLCGDFEGALAAADAAQQLDAESPLRSPHALTAHAVAVEVLTELDRAPEALERCAPVLASCEAEGMRAMARKLRAAQALAEARLGRHEPALSLMQQVITEQQELGVTGLQLGRSYELCARIAIWAKHADQFKHYAALAAEQYRPGESSVLGALYEQLAEEARQAFGEVEELDSVPDGYPESSFVEHRVSTALAGCDDHDELAQRALALLCDGQPPARGHLFLLAEDGLRLSASNVACTDTKGLAAFVESELAYERGEDDACTMTTDPNTALGADAQGGFRDQSGTRYFALALRTDVDGSSHVAGWAVLTGEDGTCHTPSTPLVAALARRLIDAGAVPRAFAV